MCKIYKIGIELEGGFDSPASRPEDCECYDDCECDRCLLCEICGDQCDDCGCDECLICTNCDEEIDDCECDIDRCGECEEKEDSCEECKEKYREENTRHDCGLAEHSTIECDQECNCECDCECEPSDSENFHFDGTVKTDAEINGEFVSPAFENLDDLMEFIDNNYPDQTNWTCGSHVHISTKKDADYTLLMKKEFKEKLLAAFQEFGEKNLHKDDYFWTRLAGGCEWAENKFRPNKQIKTFEKSGERYTHLNYCKNYKGTLELRLLPTFNNKETLKKAVKFYYNFVDNYLKSKRSRRFNVRSVIEI